MVALLGVHGRHLARKVHAGLEKGGQALLLILILRLVLWMHAAALLSHWLVFFSTCELFVTGLQRQF